MGVPLVTLISVGLSLSEGQGFVLVGPPMLAGAVAHDGLAKELRAVGGEELDIDRVDDVGLGWPDPAVAGRVN